MELLAELLFNGVLELFVELLFGGSKTRSPPAEVTRVVGFVLIGLVLGRVSLLLVPNPLIHSPSLRIANLIVSPLLAGGAGAVIAHARAQPIASRVLGAGLFALCFASMRYVLFS